MLIFRRMTYSVHALVGLALLAVLCSPWQEQTTLGPNLVFNPDFNIPKLPSNTYMKYFPPNILGWKCLNYCYIEALPLICSYYHLPCNVSYLQGMDLNSQCLFENVTQTIYIQTAGDHVLNFEWVIPLFAPIGKRFTVWLNQTPIINITHNSTSITPNKLELHFNFPIGNLAISMMMTAGDNDCWGTVITNVSIYRIIYPYNDQGFQTFLDLFMSNNATTLVNTLPGSRIFLSVLTNQYRIIDRMEFYYYHQTNFSFYSDLFLSSVNRMVLDKGSMFQLIIQNCEDQNSFCSAVNNGYTYLQQQLNQKYIYTDAQFLKRNPNGIGFYANNLDFFYYELPFILVVHIILALIFKALFNYRVSVVLRKYSFYGTFLFVLYEGNVEHFAYYFFAECKNLFSACASHKIANIFLIYFFFLMIVYVIGGLLWFTYHYRKLLKYFLEDYEFSVGSVVLESLQKSIFPLLFGCVHIFLQENHALQTIILSCTEILYLCMRIICLRYYLANRKLKIFLTSTSSMLRLTFISTFYLYRQDYQGQLINQIHLYTIVIYLLNGVFELLEEIMTCSIELKKAIQKRCKTKTEIQEIQPTKNQIKKKENSRIQASAIYAQEPLSETAHPLHRSQKSSMKKQQIKTKQYSSKRVKIMKAQTMSTRGMYLVKDGKVYSITNLKDPIAHSQSQFSLSCRLNSVKLSTTVMKKKDFQPQKTHRSCVFVQ